MTRKKGVRNGRLSHLFSLCLFRVIASVSFEVRVPPVGHAMRQVISVVVIAGKRSVARVVQLHPSPVREPDGGCDLVGCPAGTLVVREEPDVIATATPIPKGEVLLDPTLGGGSCGRLEGHAALGASDRI